MSSGLKDLDREMLPWVVLSGRSLTKGSSSQPIVSLDLLSRWSNHFRRMVRWTNMSLKWDVFVVMETLMSKTRVPWDPIETNARHS